MKKRFEEHDQVLIHGAVFRDGGGPGPTHIDCNKGVGTVIRSEGTCVWIRLEHSGLVGPGHPDGWEGATVIAHPKQLDKILITDPLSGIEFHGCLTGDCPHNDARFCLEALSEDIPELISEVRNG